jgi:hypothetical protein
MQIAQVERLQRRYEKRGGHPHYESVLQSAVAIESNSHSALESICRFRCFDDFHAFMLANLAKFRWQFVFLSPNRSIAVQQP